MHYPESPKVTRGYEKSSRKRLLWHRFLQIMILGVQENFVMVRRGVANEKV